MADPTIYVSVGIFHRKTLRSRLIQTRESVPLSISCESISSKFTFLVLFRIDLPLIPKTRRRCVFRASTNLASRSIITTGSLVLEPRITWTYSRHVRLDVRLVRCLIRNTNTTLISNTNFNYFHDFRASAFFSEWISTFEFGGIFFFTSLFGQRFIVYYGTRVEV